MAIIKFINGSTKILAKDKALEIWKVLNGEAEPTKEQEKFCATVRRIYLNRHKAPQSYLDTYQDVLRKMPAS